MVLRAWCCLDRCPDAQRVAKRSLMRIRNAIGDHLLRPRMQKITRRVGLHRHHLSLRLSLPVPV